ncbi:DUF4350 domain-containing protein [Haladaptatus salinisoli]|uniref:DUF4350 domain-containing protein n=1 Tax=Haladaptatus salinisoli TaxID=2884876 RepID=UPI001D0AEA6F|nr:DUF4350 domain-containing protein [Haladaptatus salinisoli]
MTFVSITALIIAASTSAASFGAYNSGWDGGSALRTEAKATGATPKVLQETEDYKKVPANESIAFILSPDSSYRFKSQQHIQKYVQNGGTLVVAEDFGRHSDSILQALGIQAHFDGRTVYDKRYNYRSPAMPLARNLSNHSLATNVSALTLNHGTVIRTQNGTSIAETSGYAFIDSNQNAELDGNETISNYSVVTAHAVGQGRVILVSDPSIFINAMLDRPGNEEFVQNLVRDKSYVLLDYSHSAQIPPLMAAVLIIRDSAIAQILIGGGLLFELAIWISNPRLFSRLLPGYSTNEQTHKQLMDRDAMFSYLKRKHPNWEEERIERVVTALQNRDRQD